MKMLTKALKTKLLENGASPDQDHHPVVKFFAPWGDATWLFSQIDPDDQDQIFGLCDLGFGYPELGWNSLTEICAATGPAGLKIERDLHWEATAPISLYAQAARNAGRIVDRLSDLNSKPKLPPNVEVVGFGMSDEDVAKVSDALAEQIDKHR